MDAALVFILITLLVGSPFVLLAMIAGAIEEGERSRKGTGSDR